MNRPYAQSGSADADSALPMNAPLRAILPVSRQDGTVALQ